MKRFTPVLPLVLASLLAGCSAMSYLGYRLFPDYPEDKNSRLQLAGLAEPVQVFIDELGVPHIRAASEPDLVRAVGFVQGRARFFQMDTIRRYARGRLAELVGEQKSLLGSTSRLDASMRAWGFDRAAGREVELLDPETRTLLEAYADGVNQALARYQPVEYRLLGVEPEPWRVSDTFAVGYMIAWGITHNWRHELCRLLLALGGGWQRAGRIFPAEPWPGPTSLSGAGGRAPLPPSVVDEVKGMFPAHPLHQPPAPGNDAAPLNLAPPSGASNGWVLGGQHTASGHPLLAGDPHLPHTLPSLAFQQQLATPEFDVIGMTVPGIPYVLMGHNRQVAWTMTSAVADVLDLYLERPAPGHPGQVLGPGGPEAVELHEEVIRVRKGDEFSEKTITQRRTPRGPLIDDMFPGLLPADAPLVSVHGIALGAASSIRALRRAARAQDVEQLQQALQGMMSPVNVIAAADRAGHLAMFPTGTVPVRRYHRGTFPVPAWVEKYTWTEMATPRQLPQDHGGPADFFVHANNLLLPVDSQQVLYQVDSAPSYRLERITEMIRARGRHGFASSAKIQQDVLLLRARRLLPVMLADLGAVPEGRPRSATARHPASGATHDASGEGVCSRAERSEYESAAPSRPPRPATGRPPVEQQALHLLAGWDGTASADSAACSIFWALYRQVLIEALRDEINPAGLRFLLSFRYFMNAADGWFADARHPVWDVRGTPRRETRADILHRAWPLALAWLADRLGPQPASWQWGRLHYLQIDHPFGAQASAFNLERWPAPGGSASVWKSHFDMGNELEPFRAKYGPVYRMLVDLGDIDHGRWVIDTGSSGWPRSPHYADQFAMWKAVDYAPMVSDWAEVERQSRALMELLPRQNTP